MKKISIYIAIAIISLVTLLFGLNIGLKIYFNNYFYTVPDVISMNVEEIKKTKDIENLNLVIAGEGFSELPVGTVYRQEPAPEKTVKRGRTFKVWISKGLNLYTVPDFVNKNLMDVSTILANSDVEIEKISYINSNLPYNIILATNPSANNTTLSERKISILVSSSSTNKSVEIPDTIGFTFDEALKVLNEKGFIIGTITKKTIPNFEPNIVVDIDNLGKEVPFGSIVNLTISE